MRNKYGGPNVDDHHATAATDLSTLLTQCRDDANSDQPVDGPMMIHTRNGWNGIETLRRATPEEEKFWENLARERRRPQFIYPLDKEEEVDELEDF